MVMEMQTVQEQKCETVPEQVCRTVMEQVCDGNGQSGGWGKAQTRTQGNSRWKRAPIFDKIIGAKLNSSGICLEEIK